MLVTRDSLLAGAQAARGVAIVVDVFRAFTCAPLMFSLGLEKAILVSEIDEALALKKQDPDLILVGEMAGQPVAGFDLGNSPSLILRQEPGFFKGRTVVQRTSAGVQGALAALKAADQVYLGSFTVAKSTVRHVLSLSPERVSIVAMGVQLKAKAPEDEWCACYFAYLLGVADYDHNQAMREILFQGTMQKFFDPERQWFPPEDPTLCLQRDIHGFALRVFQEGERVVARMIPVEAPLV